MADFVAVLKKTLDGLGETTPDMRAKVYDKARATIAAKLAAINPPPPPAVADRQKRALEDAIAQVERGYAKPAPADPLAELESIFSSIDRNRTQPTHARPGAKAEPAPQRPVIETRQAPEPAKPAPAPRPAEQRWQAPAAEPKPAAASPQPSPQPRPAPDTAWKRDSLSKPPSIRTAPELEDEADFNADEEMLPAAGDTIASDRFDDEDRPRRGFGGLIAAAVALAVIGGAAYGVWLNRDAFKDMIASLTKSGAKTEVAATPPKAETKPAAAATPPDTNAGTSEPQKFTQRLQADGKETDPGPGGSANGVGEGTSVVALTTPPPTATPPAATPPAATPPAATPPAAAPATATPPAAAQTPPAADGAQAGTRDAAKPADGAAAPAPAAGADQPLAVAQKAIFYQERTATQQGSADQGTIVWSLVQESPGGDAPPEPAIRAEATIPGKNIQLRMTIRRNTDKTLPASHIIEMIFLTPDGFEGGGIDNVLRIAMKGTEQEAGSPLIGVPAKIADGYFLIALNDTKADEDANLTLLRNQDWIDIPVVYKSGRRALLTMEKGLPGEKVFDDAMKAWSAKGSG